MQVEAYKGSTTYCTAKGSDVDANAGLVVYARPQIDGGCEISARAGSTVYAYNYSEVFAYEGSTTIAYNGGKVMVYSGSVTYAYPGVDLIQVLVRRKVIEKS